MTRPSSQRKRPPRPLDAPRLEELALHYVGRFATTRAKLVRYLSRKLRERGWDGDDPPDLDALAAKFETYGYVDDAAYGAMKARDLTARGYGPNRVGQALFQAGVGENDRGEAEALADAAAVDAALKYAARRRIGPYAIEAFEDEKARERAVAAFLRAGHRFALVRAIVDLPPGEEPDRESLSNLR